MNDIGLSSAIKFENVSKKYGSHHALKDVSFEVHEGEIVGFLGPNGAGKTTAMRILSGFFPPTSGHVSICGVDMFKHPHKAKRAIGYLPETVSLYPDMKVIEYLRFVAELKGVPAHEMRGHLRSKMSFCGLEDSGHRLIGRLSKGYRQRVGLAQALIADPRVLVLDEPTTGLDPTQIKEIRDLIHALGQSRAVILSTHILPEVSMLCNRVMMINQGQILASGTVPELASCLRDREAVHIKILDLRDQERALEILASIPGVEALQIVEETKGDAIISLETPPDLDLRPRIMELLLAAKIPLAEIRRHQLTLEEVFLGLLKDRNLGRRF